MWECYIIYLITQSVATFGFLDYIIVLLASSKGKRLFKIFLFQYSFMYNLENIYIFCEKSTFSMYLT